MTKIAELIHYLEQVAPSQYQESYDNAGLITGNADVPVSSVLVTLDCTEEVVEEAARKKCNFIVTHHPIIFKGLKQLTGKTYVERSIIKAIKNDICIYAIHTNLIHPYGKKYRNLFDIRVYEVRDCLHLVFRYIRWTFGH